MKIETKNFIVNKLRSASMHWKPKNHAKKLQQVGPAAFRCVICGVIVYEGKKLLDVIQPEYPGERVISGIVELDHFPPVVPLEGFKTGIKIEGKKKSYLWDWNQYLERLFCEMESFRVLCQSCHLEVSNQQKSTKSLDKLK